MDSAAWRRLAPLVDQVLDLPDADRPGFLAELAARDPELGRELAAFVERESASRGLFDATLGAQASGLLAEIGADERSWDALRLADARVGPYRVVRELGR